MGGQARSELNAEQRRLAEARGGEAPWRRWGPYLSERQWGTVREDYSDSGNAWDYFSHDHARSRAYRWGEDGLAGISDDRQRLCFALALWNGRDPILKERLFGLTNNETNHGEDVKEYCFYLDSTLTHSYMKYLYKYPQSAYPYGDLVETNRRRSRHEFEYELLDTGVFDQDRYFDVFVEYAKASPEDMADARVVAAPRPALEETHGDQPHTADARPGHAEMALQVGVEIPLLVDPLAEALRARAHHDVQLAVAQRGGLYPPYPDLTEDDVPDVDRLRTWTQEHSQNCLSPDVGAAARELLDRLRVLGGGVRALAGAEERLARLRAEREAWEAELDGLCAGGGSPIPPRRALRELERALPEHAMVSTDIGNVCSTANSHLRFE